LFDLRPEDIRVVVHPQSIIHSMVVCRDASVLAQLGTPDMRVPIAYGLSFPSRIPSGASTLDLLSVSSLTFEAPDDVRFPGLKLAYDVLAQPEGSSVVLNAANEVAVEAFLDRRISFTDIYRVNRGTIEAMAGRFAVPGSLEDLLDLDARSRSQAMSLVSRGGRS
jgi:1-deoxy-D-xylulose-5-phosphate reductoisomerase